VIAVRGEHIGGSPADHHRREVQWRQRRRRQEVVEYANHVLVPIQRVTVPRQVPRQAKYGADLHPEKLSTASLQRSKNNFTLFPPEDPNAFKNKTWQSGESTAFPIDD